MWFYMLWVLLLLLAWLLLFHRKRSTDLGGPSGLPYIGNLLQLDPKQPHLTLTEWAKQHGGVYKIKLLGKEIVIVNSEAQIRQVLVTKSDDFAGRPYLYRFEYIIEDDIIFKSQSPRWSLLKKHCMTGLKLVGDGVKRLEQIASALVDSMVKTMKEKNGKPFNPKLLLHETVCSINATLVWVNTWYLHHDPKLWEDPWEVKPERFLDKEGKLLPPDHEYRKRLFPFGAGRRVCVGEALARNRLFLFVCTLLQKFTFLPEEDGADVPSDPRTWNFGSVCAPEDFKIRAIFRD